jgi:hypothetical protein
MFGVGQVNGNWNWETSVVALNTQVDIVMAG